MTDDKKFQDDAPEWDEMDAEEQQDALDAAGGRPIAYIRSVAKEDLQESLPPGAPDGPYFALHDEDGRPLALFSDAASAWAAARANNMQTLSVH